MLAAAGVKLPGPSRAGSEAGLRTSCPETECRTREEGTASVYGYTGELRANSQGTSGQAREEDAANVYGYTGTL